MSKIIILDRWQWEHFVNDSSATRDVFVDLWYKGEQKNALIKLTLCDEVVDWCNMQDIRLPFGELKYKEEFDQDGFLWCHLYATLTFENDDDALLFKMKWL